MSLVLAARRRVRTLSAASGVVFWGLPIGPAAAPSKAIGRIFASRSGCRSPHAGMKKALNHWVNTQPESSGFPVTGMASFRCRAL